MSNGGLALLGIGGLAVIGIALKVKIENLKDQIRVLNSRVISLVNENDDLKSIIRQKDSELSQKDNEIGNLKEQLTKNTAKLP